jgi:hypothetical protein
MNRITNSVANNAANTVVSKVADKASSFFPQVDTDVNGWLTVDGREYEICQFDIEIKQWVDFKGQPQSEVRGGQILVVLTETLPESMCHWAMRTQAKNGEVVFKSKTASAPLKVQFTNGYCMDLVRSTHDKLGLRTRLVISYEKVVINGIELDNRWVR